MEVRTALVVAVLTILSVVIKQGEAIQCLECNVWKAGYGHLCSNPRVRDDCVACMKTETTIFMGYYKNTPRSSTTTSRICAKSKTVHFSDECFYYSSADGHSVRCYCHEDNCNSSPKTQSSSLKYVSAMALFCFIVQRLF